MHFHATLLSGEVTNIGQRKGPLIEEKCLLKISKREREVAGIHVEVLIIKTQLR